MRRLAASTLVVFLAALMLAAPPEGAAQTPPPLRYVALGDSLTAGYGVAPEEGYVSLYAGHLTTNTGRTVHTTNLGRNGWTSADLLRALRRSPGFRQEIGQADVVTLHIGTNDLHVARARYKGLLKNQPCGGADGQDCLRTAVRAFKANWDASVQEVRRLRGGRPTALRTGTLYNAYVAADRLQDSRKGDGGMNDLQVIKKHFDAANRHVAGRSAALGVPFAGVYGAFNGPSGAEDPKAKGYMQRDWLHLSPTGNTVVADLFGNTGYAPLTPAR